MRGPGVDLAKARQSVHAVPTVSLIEPLMGERFALLSMRKVVIAAAGFTSVECVGVARHMPCGSISSAFRSETPPPRRMPTDRASAHCESCIFSRNLPGKEIFDIAFKAFSSEANTGGFFLFEHPEQLDTVKTDDVPARSGIFQTCVH